MEILLFLFIHKYVVLILIPISISKLLSESLAPTSRFIPQPRKKHEGYVNIFCNIYAKCYFHSQNQPPKKYKFQSINHEMINSELTSNVLNTTSFIINQNSEVHVLEKLVFTIFLVNKTSFIINQKYWKNNCV